MTSPLLAQEQPPLPRPRPEAAAVPAPVAQQPAAQEPVVPLPRPRPEKAAEATPAADAPAAEDKPSSETPAIDAPAPVEEASKPDEPPPPPRIYQTACPAVISGQVEAKALPPIENNICRVQSPLSVTGVLANGRMIPFSGEATLDCGMATALPAWVGDVDGYLRSYAETGIESVIVGTSYMCRNVNNAAEGNTSFHGFGDALDVVGFKLEDGRTVTVEEAWTGESEEERRIVRFAHDAACTRFTTVLGPEANALHHDHLHLDLGCHGSRCVARLCE
jgi:hypothetical protein